MTTEAAAVVASAVAVAGAGAGAVAVAVAVAYVLKCVLLTFHFQVLWISHAARVRVHL